MREKDSMKPPPPLLVPGLAGRSWRDRVLSHPRLLLLALPLFLALAILPVGALASYTTSNSQFCLGCHGAGDTPDRSVRSLVHPDFNRVGCVDCHAKPGQVVYEGYVRGFMAEPDRVVPNCERCHSEMTARNDQNGFRFNFVGIPITHEKHLQRGATCLSCHENVAHDLRQPPTNRPRMDSCYACHARTETCAKCHQNGVPSGPAPFAASAAGDVQVDGKALFLRNCAGCHGPQGDRVPQANLTSATALQDAQAGRWRTTVMQGSGEMPPMAKARGGPLADDQITAVLAYLQLQAQAAADVPADARALYGRYCVTCHGDDGAKLASVPLNNPNYWQGKSDAQVRSTISTGWGGMPGFATRAGGGLSPAEINSLVTFLHGLVPAKPKVDTAQGQALFASKCAACHGADGALQPSANLGDKAYVQGRGEADLIQATSAGRGGMPPMGKASGGQLSDEEIAAIVRYLLSR
ncbi:MAG: c-type cytochrome [Chloroflexota bacterium]